VGGWKIQTVQQDRFFFPVKVQRKIFFSQYISRQEFSLANEFSLCFYFIWLCLNVPHTKACRFTYKKCITAPKPKTCRDRVEYSKMGEVQYMNDL
jgi:hypothetical protein